MRSYPLFKLKEIEDMKPDLIILDILFGNQQPIGWVMLNLLKLSPSTVAIPVIICTAALKEILERQEYLASKGVIVLLKPFFVDDMLDALKRALPA